MQLIVYAKLLSRGMTKVQTWSGYLNIIVTLPLVFTPKSDTGNKVGSEKPHTSVHLNIDSVKFSENLSSCWLYLGVFWFLKALLCLNSRIISMLWLLLLLYYMESNICNMWNIFASQAYSTEYICVTSWMINYFLFLAIIHLPRFISISFINLDSEQSTIRHTWSNI